MSIEQFEHDGFNSPREVEVAWQLQAAQDIKTYGRAMRAGHDNIAVSIEERWGLYGYKPEIVSTVLSCVATGLPLDAAIREVTGS